MDVIQIEPRRARVPDARRAHRGDERHVAQQDGADLRCDEYSPYCWKTKPGALSRVVGLFSQRGYNIETSECGAYRRPLAVEADGDHERATT